MIFNESLISLIEKRVSIRVIWTFLTDTHFQVDRKKKPCCRRDFMARSIRTSHSEPHFLQITPITPIRLRPKWIFCWLGYQCIIPQFRLVTLSNADLKWINYQIHSARFFLNLSITRNNTLPSTARLDEIPVDFIANFELLLNKILIN